MKKLWIFCLIIFGIPAPVFAQQKVPILIYHSIDEYNGHGIKELYVTPENFEKQMTYLKDHGYTLLTFERWQDMNKVNKPIFITFDDGYKNNLNAFSIFQKLKTAHFQPTGTIFVISDFINRSNRLAESDIKMLVNSGIFSIQSHTATHPDLTKIEDYQYELKGSKEKIEKISGKPVIALAYPYGNFNDRVVKETMKYYRFGITTTPELFSEHGIKNELFYIPRIYVKYSTTLKDFAKAVKGE
ncbi:polysaccharide deacetylase family protein [Neobacillus ginsengisoli]|uniref:Peptidoglycan/xylan/chitin deacetylase (PgdA/CDA1 family) n=1 Tax=Neobacillus ginsengisoli TaxID=904295 RepID=A0ABT9XQI1_9BACI|nr:polysaccharide deacetylase family protein [Neobacillus ginsengisoli]MDQ0197811.1 peptidoglycan/xylan/chitin deacetylase (PgdA/CDA1 family) [Neobacillus ginsengisoli]